MCGHLGTWLRLCGTGNQSENNYLPVEDRDKPISRQPHSSTSNSGGPRDKRQSIYATKYGLYIVCYTGDVTQAEAEGIVTGEGPGMTGPSMVTKVLLNIAQLRYRDLRDAVEEQYDTLALERGEVYSLNTERCEMRLPFKMIFLAIVFRFDDRDDEEHWKQYMGQLYTNILKEADKENLESVALPLLGTGNAGAPDEVAIDAIVQSFSQFAPRHLKRVLIVSFHDNARDKMVQKFQEYFTKESKQDSEVTKEQLPEGNNSKIPNTNSSADAMGDNFHGNNLSLLNGTDKFKGSQKKQPETAVLIEYSSEFTGRDNQSKHQQQLHDSWSVADRDNQSKHQQQLHDSWSVADRDNQSKHQQQLHDSWSVADRDNQSKHQQQLHDSWSVADRDNQSKHQQQLHDSWSVTDRDKPISRPPHSSTYNSGGPSDKRQSIYATKHALDIVCYTGDVTEAEAEGIVTGEGPGMTAPSMVTKVLLNIARLRYSGLRDAVEEQYGTLALETGEVYSLNTERCEMRLPFKMIFLAIVFRFDDRDDEEHWKQYMGQLYTNILKEADKENLESVALPLLGTGNAGAPDEVAIDAIIQSFSQFAPRHLKRVLIVSFHDNVHDKMVQKFQEYFAKESKQDSEVAKEQLPKGSNSKIPNTNSCANAMGDNFHGNNLSLLNGTDKFKGSQKKQPETAVLIEYSSEFTGRDNQSKHQQQLHDSWSGHIQSRGPNSNHEQMQLRFPGSGSIGISSASYDTFLQEPTLLNKKEYTTHNALTVTCYTGDVTEARAEGIVTGEGYGMTNASLVTKALCKQGNISYRELGTLVVDKYHTVGFESGEVYCIETGKCNIQLQFKIIFLAIVLRINEARNEDDWENHMSRLYMRILDKAEKKKIQSIAIPLLGSGRAGAAVKLAVKPLVQTLSRFKPNCLKSVMVISFQDNVHAMIVQQCEELFSQDLGFLNMKHNAETYLVESKEKSFQDIQDISIGAYGHNDGGNRTPVIQNEWFDHDAHVNQPVRKQNEANSDHNVDGDQPVSNDNKVSSTHSQNGDATKTFQSTIPDASSTHSKSRLSVDVHPKPSASADVTGVDVGGAASLTPDDKKKNLSQILSPQEIQVSVLEVTSDSATITKNACSEEEAFIASDSQKSATSIKGDLKEYETDLHPAEKTEVDDKREDTADQSGAFVRHVTHLESEAQPDKKTLDGVKAGETTEQQLSALVPSEYEVDQAANAVTTGKTTNQQSSGHVSSECEDALKMETASTEDVCAICMDVISNPKTLHACQHTFCTACIDDCFNNFKPVCPTCNTVYGTLTGDQPDGKMADKIIEDISIPGYEGHGVIIIDYYFEDGIQTDKHPNPGKPYHGTRRRGFLPDNSEGQSILKLLRKAFDQKLTFTIGRSTTTGLEDMVTWNDIHHKTNTHGGPTRFGYPDPTYLSRVRDELASKGVKE